MAATMMAQATGTAGYAHVTKTPGVCGGKACIEDTRIRVMDVVVRYGGGWTVERIIGEAYPNLTPAQIHSALAYHFDHPEEVEQELQRERDFEERYEADRSDYLASRPR